MGNDALQMETLGERRSRLIADRDKMAADWRQTDAEKQQDSSTSKVRKKKKKQQKQKEEIGNGSRR